jgi:predicted transcriptional regulator
MYPKFLRKKYFIAIFVVLVLSIGGAVWFFGFAPVLSVDGKSVSMGEFSKIQTAITQSDELSHKNSTTTPATEIKKMVLWNIIDRKLLDKIVNDTDPSIEQKAIDIVNEALAGNQEFSLAEASRRLYGLTEKDFIALVLIPQAKRNLLSDRFKDDPSLLNKKWEDMTNSANVKIFYPGFYWENGEVKLK